MRAITFLVVAVAVICNPSTNGFEIDFTPDDDEPFTIPTMPDPFQIPDEPFLIPDKPLQIPEEPFLMPDIPFLKPPFDIDDLPIFVLPEDPPIIDIPLITLPDENISKVPVTYNIIRHISSDVNSTIDYDHANPYVQENMSRGLCSTTSYCYKGQCWAYCGADLAAGSWCYTTKKQSQSKEYVSCTKNSECNPCWNCAGACGT